MYTIYVHIIIQEMLLAVDELQQLPLLLLLKLHVQKSCLRAAAAFVRHRVPDDAICCCGFLAPDSSVSFLYFNTIYVNAPLGSAVAFTASISAWNPILIIYGMHPGNYVHTRSQGER